MEQTMFLSTSSGWIDDEKVVCCPPVEEARLVTQQLVKST